MATRGDRNRDEGIASRIRPKQVVFGIVVVIIAVFALVNTETVNVDFVVADADAALIVVILVSAVLGALVGWLAPRLRRDD
ncbi:MAG TPA: LapA family protein [Acidimicrobiia bacterium]|nr:LapA family protein [Acidimicrobiia bacterium]